MERRTTWTCWLRPRKSIYSASASPSNRPVVFRLCSLQQRPRGQAAQKPQPRRAGRLHPVALRGVPGDKEARLRLLAGPKDHRRPLDYAPRIGGHVRYLWPHAVSPHFQQSRIENEYLIEREIVPITPPRTTTSARRPSTRTSAMPASGRPLMTPSKAQRSPRSRNTSETQNPPSSNSGLQR